MTQKEALEELLKILVEAKVISKVSEKWVLRALDRSEKPKDGKK